MPASEYKNILFDFLMQPRFRVWRHLLFIAVLIPICLSQAFFALGAAPGMPVSTIYVFGICFSMTMIALAWFNLYVLTPRFLLKQRYTAYILIFSLAVTGIMAVRYFAGARVMGVPGIVNGVTVLDWLSNGTLYAIGIACSSVTVLLREWVEDHRRIGNLESERLKNDIGEFRNRINPQLLYATLDYAAAGVKSDPARTSDILFRLSELLRYQLYDSKRETVLLESEIAYIRNYLALQQESDKDGFTWSVSAEGKTGRFVAPALLMPLVEAIMSRRPSSLSVHLTAGEHCITLNCTAAGTDLSGCDLSLIGQRLSVQGIGFRLDKTNESIEMKLC